MDGVLIDPLLDGIRLATNLGGEVVEGSFRGLGPESIGSQGRLRSPRRGAMPIGWAHAFLVRAAPSLRS
jgi:hypothetical protein